jgi:hypothetical protein
VVLIATYFPDSKSSKERAKLQCTEFFYWWHNKPGSNTLQGFDEWWEERGKELK